MSRKEPYIEGEDKEERGISLKGGSIRFKTFIIKKKEAYYVPESLQRYLGKDFHSLMPSHYSKDEERERRDILQESLKRIAEIIDERVIYRAIETSKEDLDTFRLGRHWSGSLNAVSTRHNYHKFAENELIPTVIIKAKIEEDYIPDLDKYIDFNKSIELQMTWGDIEDEILIFDTRCLEIRKICEAESLKKAKKCMKNPK
jgi:hypothetical protein